MNETIRRELEVAFSKHSQPVWFRIVKYAILFGLVYFFWDNHLLWWSLLVGFIAATGVHFFYRYRTKGWTRSYGLWNYEKNKPNNTLSK